MKIGIFGVIGEDVLPQDIKAQLDGQGDITVLMDSPGGEVFSGMAIYNMLKSHKGNIEVEIVGMAGSIATVIASAGDIVKISETGAYFVHSALTPSTSGNADELRDAADTLETISNTIRSVYEAKTGLAGDSLQALMDEETMMTAKEALALGFVDEIINPIAIAAKFKTNIDMSKLTELKVQAAAIGKRLGIVNEDIPAEVEEALDKEIQEVVEEGIKEAEETGTELEALSDMVARAEFETYKAEILALIKPVLEAMAEVPSKEEMETEVNAKTTIKIQGILNAMKSKTTIPSQKNDFAPVEVENSNKLKFGFLQAKQNELKTKNGY